MCKQTFFRTRSRGGTWPSGPSPHRPGPPWGAGDAEGRTPPAEQRRPPPPPPPGAPAWDVSAAALGRDRRTVLGGQARPGGGGVVMESVGPAQAPPAAPSAQMVLKCRFSGPIFDLLNQKPGDGGGGQNFVLSPPDDPDS